MESHHQVSHFTREPGKDALSLHPYLQYLSNHLQRQYVKTIKSKESKTTEQNTKLAFMQMIYYYTFRTLTNLYEQHLMSLQPSPPSHHIL